MIAVDGRQVLIFPSDTDMELLIISIRNRKIADAYRAQFELLWKRAKA